MKLRTKTIMTVSLLSILVFVSIQGIMFLILKPTFEATDNRLCTQQTCRVKSIIDYRISSLAANTKAYAIWDDTYRFAKGENDEYIDNNYDDYAFENLRINLVAIAGNETGLIYYQSFDLGATQKVVSSQDVKGFVCSQDIWAFDSINDTNSGIVEIDGKPLMFVSAPILTSEAEGPMVGGLLFGRYLDNQEINILTAFSGINFTLTLLSEFHDSKTLDTLVTGEAASTLKINNEETLSAYTLLNDIHSDPTFVIQVTIARNSYQQGLFLQNIFLVTAVVLSAAFGFVMYRLLAREVVKPLTKMASYVEEISLNPNFSPPQMPKTEEYNVLTDAVKNTLKRKLEGMNEVSVMVAHDLRNPLAGIRNSVYVLKKRYASGLDEEGVAILRRIDDSVVYADRIVQNLLDYSSEIKLDKVKMSPKGLVNRTLSKLTIPSKIEVINETSDETSLLVDPGKIEQVFTNLVTNGFDSMPDGGTLRISSRKLKGGIVEIDFADSGTGMSSAVLENLWKPFFTTKAKGMGIGLSICKRIVEAHRGKIEVETAEGKGSCFAVFLPEE